MINKKTNRRNFLKVLGISALGLLSIGCGGEVFVSREQKDVEGASGELEDYVEVYRLSSRKAKDKACKNHAYNYYFKTESDVIRAHDGCKCRIVKQNLKKSLYESFFPEGSIGAYRV
ncbi:MAG: hypothetical protein ABIA04_01145 [Pseudomonadota bacterium]